MDVVFSEEHRLHDPISFLVRGQLAAPAEVPRRAEVLHQAVAGDHAVVAPASFDDACVARAHSADYLAFLEGAHRRWSELPGSGPEILPNVFPSRLQASRPEHIVGQAGYHMGDGACPIGAGTWKAARASADVALTAADKVRNGASHAFALCRPPGHHAFRDMAAGFCFLNNVAIATEHMLPTHGRAAIVDFDVHHGNGTQAIFWEREDVLFISIHCDPTNFYPFFWGYAHERGAGRGTGASRNLPLAPGTDDTGFLEALDSALETVAAFDPGVLLVSAGFDAQENDPLGVLKITTGGFGRVGERFGAFAAERDLPSVLVQEGGYLCDELGANLAAFLAGFETTRG
jgi:acetoin utilization deacetylase AcuC-like enzyme